MSTGQSYNARTYGRKTSAKRKQAIESIFESRKRRKGSLEPEELTDVEEPTPTTPKQPTTLARDLSDIFQSFPPKGSPASTPTKLARRMLARSKTDSSIESSNAFQLDRTPSLPNIPSSSPPKPPTPSKLVRPHPIPVTTNARTYAGKSRSFLVAIPAASLAVDQDEDEYSSRESYASLRSRWGVDNSEDDPSPGNPSPSRSDATSTSGGTPTKTKRKTRELQDALLRAKFSLASGMMNPLKSITELRSKGESRRFLDEVGYLFEGMDPMVGIGLRRASALEIVTKLCDSEFSRKAKAADFLSRAWDVFIEAGAGNGEDKILDTLLAFFTALVAEDPASLRDLAEHPPPTPTMPDAGSSKITASQQLSSPRATIVDTLFSLLSAPSDPLALVSVSSSEEKAKNEVELRKLGVGKKDRTILQTVHETIVSKSHLFPSNTIISTPLLILHTLQALPPSLIPHRHLLALLTALRYMLSPVLSPATSGYLAWPDAKTHIAFETVLCALRLLDVYLLGQWGSALLDEETDESEKRAMKRAREAEVEKAREEWLAEGLIALGVCTELAGGVSLTHSDETWGCKVIDSECALGFILRVILGSRSTGDNAGVAKKEQESESAARLINGKGKAKVEEGADEDDQTSHNLDTLCLALGLLTNLVQVVDRTKDLLRDFRAYPPRLLKSLHILISSYDIGIDPTCTLKRRTCIRSCACSHPTSALDILITLYTRQTPLPSHGPVKSEPLSIDVTEPPDHDSDALFLRGHLSVLFGLLIRGSSENKGYILGKLSGPESLVEHARDFAAFYDTFGGEAEGRVAREVVTFLEGLWA
ncbi:hypothetical protein H0H87_007312 [Tephrocybe sp. NHM501043]|nr:hypothetical protein H0H87_007312 [Tephrocybe sp. NHM501043]